MITVLQKVSTIKRQQRVISQVKGIAAAKTKPFQDFNDSNLILHGYFCTKYTLLIQLLKIKKVSLNACWPKIAMFLAWKGLIFWRKTIRCQSLFNRDLNTIWWTFCTCGSKRITLAHTPRGSMAFMWALPMTSLAANVRKSFLEVKGRAPDFQLPIHAGLLFLSSIINFPFPLPNACMNCSDTDTRAWH